MKKYLVGATFAFGILFSPTLTQAAGLTSAQVQSILALISSFGADSATIANVSAALTGSGGTSATGASSFCYKFNTDLTIGSSGTDVSALNQALTASGINTIGNTSLFDENTAADVVQFQAKYGIRQTGYVGPITRAKLNALYGCNQTTTVSTMSDQATMPNKTSSNDTASTLTVHTKWELVSSKGKITQRLQYASPTLMYGIGLDNGVGNGGRVWMWSGVDSWSPVTPPGAAIQDDFVFVNGTDIYAIGMEKQIWRWTQSNGWQPFSSNGKIQKKIKYVDQNHIYGIGIDSRIWRWANNLQGVTPDIQGNVAGSGWVAVTSPQNTTRDDFALVNNSESDIYGIGFDNQIWHWDGTHWSQTSSGGQIKQQLFYVSPTLMYGIGLDGNIWKWTGGSNWTQITNGTPIQNFTLVNNSENDIYAIGMDNQIWHWSTNPAQTITISRTPTTSQTNSYKVGDATVLSSVNSPSLFATDYTGTGYNQIGSNTPRALTFSTRQLVESGACNASTGACTIPGNWSATDFVCPAGVTGVQQMKEWYTIGDTTSNTLTWYFECSVSGISSTKTPVGSLDGIDTSGVASGWAVDPDSPPTAISVHFYIDGAAGQGGTYAGSAVANLASAAANSAGYSGNHGYTFSVPQQWRDGKQHALHVHGIDLSGDSSKNVLLSNVPKSFTLVK